jgi:hypothetical protein
VLSNEAMQLTKRTEAGERAPSRTRLHLKGASQLIAGVGRTHNERACATSDRSGTACPRTVLQKGDVMLKQLLVVGVLLAAWPRSGNGDDAQGVVEGRFVMNPSEDGKPLGTAFEVWDTVCMLRKSPTVEKPSCSITAVSLVEMLGKTHVYTWRHDSTAVIEVRPSVFRVELNGRESTCSGLEVFVTLDAKTGALRDMTGSLRAGTKCQSVDAYGLDTKAASRPVAPVWNPTYGQGE